MVGNSTRLQVIPQQSTQNTANFPITDIREKPVNFFHCSTRVPTLVSAITLLTQVPWKKFPFLFIIIIPWKSVHRFESCKLLLFIHVTIRPPALKATSNSSGSKSQSDDEPTQKAVADRFSMWEKRAGDSLTPLRQATPLNRAASANRPAFKGLCRRI